MPTDTYGYVLQAVVYAFAGKIEESRLAIDSLRKSYPTFTLGDFISHELYQNPMDLERVATAIRNAGLPE